MKPEKEKYDLVYQVVGYAMEGINHPRKIGISAPLRQSLDNEVADV
jgi:hypothetical protein